MRNVSTEHIALFSLRSEGFINEGSECVGLCSLPDLQSVLLALDTGELIQVGSRLTLSYV